MVVHSNPCQLTVETLEENGESLIVRAKERYVKEYLLRTKSHGIIIFVLSGAIGIMIALSVAPSTHFDSEFSKSCIRILFGLCFASVWLGIYFLLRRYEVRRRKSEVEKPVMLLSLIRELMQEELDQRSPPLHKGVYNILKKFRNSEWIHALRRSDIEAIDRVLDNLRCFNHAQAEKVNLASEQQFRWIENRLKSSVS
jgi:hypothetical protein